ncbi:MAG: rRNA small subunit methyltransferase B [Micrococcales bacterium]|nr:rRNA small subunit methyltransferase B [Micrococcales bacterium]
MRAVDQGAYANLTLPKMLRDAGLWGRDAAFATELAYGATRWRGTYDAVINHTSGRDQIEPAVLNCLRLGVHQIANMRVPDHAAVAATVALTREKIGIGPSKFVNALLRAVTEQGYQEILDQAAPDDGSLDNLAVRLSHPPWIVRAIRQAMIGSGRDPEQLAAVLGANNQPTTATLVARPGLITSQELADQVKAKTGSDAQLGRWVPTAVQMTGGMPGDLPAVRGAQAAVQDEGSQIVALALVGVPISDDQGRWLDMCAGPGGKSALLAGLLKERGPGKLVANEPQPHRARLVAQALRNYQDVSQVTEEDGRSIQGQFDRVLVDVPCTGLGALRRRPEARWRHSPRDLGSLRPLQHELLQAALDATRPGGVCLYSACSPHLAEGLQTIDDLLKANPKAELVSASQLGFVKATGAVLDNGTVQLWTDQHGTDAMFMALLTVTK